MIPEITSRRSYSREFTKFARKRRVSKRWSAQTSSWKSRKTCALTSRSRPGRFLKHQVRPRFVRVEPKLLQAPPEPLKVNFGQFLAHSLSTLAKPARPCGVRLSEI